MEKIQNNQTQITESRQSQETSQNTVPVPDRDTATVISSIIDRARLAMQWNRLQQSSQRGEQSEQDAAIISWYGICLDAGMRLEQYEPCYRAAQDRKRELRKQGQPLTVVTPYDLCDELEKVRAMNAELDRTRLLPENAAAACSRCFGTGFERMPDGTVKPNCPHDQWTPEDESRLELSEEERRADIRKQAEIMREAMSKIGNPKPAVVEVEKRPKGRQLKCSSCPRVVDTIFGFEEGQVCGDLLNRGTHDGPLKFCEGRFTELFTPS